jgi:hypothetical protein
MSLQLFLGGLQLQLSLQRLLLHDVIAATAAKRDIIIAAKRYDLSELQLYFPAHCTQLDPLSSP